MNARERGFLLLTSHLGDPSRKPLTPAQLRTLARRVRTMDRPDSDRDLQLEDLLALGYNRQTSGHILELLEQEEVLEHYLSRGRKLGCTPITRVSQHYPPLLRRRLGDDSPGCLWAKGDISLLNTPAISLVGSRDLRQENRSFAEAVGTYAADQGLTLISGNARGADKAAQNACREAGGRVISIVADSLASHVLQEKVLYLSEEDFDAEFSAQRAISRNRCIHAMGRMVFVAQANLEKGGTWDGTVKNLRHGWSSVACFRDGSDAAGELEQRGAFLIRTEHLPDFQILAEDNKSLFDR